VLKFFIPGQNRVHWWHSDRVRLDTNRLRTPVIGQLRTRMVFLRMWMLKYPCLHISMN